MVEIDEHFYHLKLLRKAGYQRAASHPDLDAAQESLLLRELLKELLRSPATEKRSIDFRAKLAETDQAAANFHTLMVDSPVDLRKAEDGYQRLSNACAACHKAYRN
jgi:hypothetical protein